MPISFARIVKYWFARCQRLMSGINIVPMCIAILMTMTGCGGDPPTGTKVDTRAVVWRVNATPNGAVVLAVGDTLRLAVRGFNVDSSSAPLVQNNLTFVTDDNSLVDVSPTGLIRAVAPTGGVPIKVVATYQTIGTFVTDTTFVAVTATRENVRSIGFQPDSTRISLQYYYLVNPVALDQNGQVAPGVFVGISTAPNALSITGVDKQYNSLWFNNVGPQWIYASTLAYGTRYTDSILVTALYAPAGGVQLVNVGHGVGLSGSPPNPVISDVQGCATVYFSNGSSISVNIKFVRNITPISCASTGDTLMTIPITNLQVGSATVRKIAGIGSVRWIAERAAAPHDSLIGATYTTH